MDNVLHIYAWFLLAVTVLPALARIVKPRELARIILVRYQNPKRRKRARIGGFIFIALCVVLGPVLLMSPQRQQRWLIIAVLVILVSAIEFVMNSRSFNEEALTRQNRIFGGVYTSLAIAIALLLLTR